MLDRRSRAGAGMKASFGGGAALDRERKKDWIKTAILVAIVMLVGLFALDQLIGDPGAIDRPTVDHGY